MLIFFSLELNSHHTQYLTVLFCQHIQVLILSLLYPSIDLAKLIHSVSQLSQSEIQKKKIDKRWRSPDSLEIIMKQNSSLLFLTDTFCNRIKILWFILAYSPWIESDLILKQISLMILISILAIAFCWSVGRGERFSYDCLLIVYPLLFFG